MSDWDDSDFEGNAPAAAAPATKAAAANGSANGAGAAPAVVPVRGRFADEEDDDDEEVKSSWEDSDDDEGQKRKAAAAAAAANKPAPPVRQKGITKAKIAEKEAAEQAKLEAALAASKEDPLEKKRRDMQMSIAADIDAASKLFGDASLADLPASAKKDIVAAANPLLAVPNPRTKADFEKLSDSLSKAMIDLYGNKPLYPEFLKHFVRNLAMPCKDIDVKAAASALSALGNEKQREAKEATGKKGGKGKGKPQLGTVAGGAGAKAGVTGRGYAADLELHDEAMDDDDDFM